MTAPARRLATRALGLLAGLALGSCSGGDKTTGPSVQPGQVAVAVGFDPLVLAAVPISRVHITALLTGTSTVALDTTVPFPSSVDTVNLTLPVTITGSSQTFDLDIDLLNAAGSVVFHSGPTPLVATAVGVPPPLSRPVFHYVGTGAGAAGVRFTATPGTVFYGDSVTFVAEAYDAGNAAIPGTPILFSSSDTSKAKPSSVVPGRVLARTTRGSVTITATLLTSPSISAALVVQPKPAAIGITGGNSQVASVGQALAQPIVARVKAADSVGVQGVIVTWAVTSGGGTLSTVTDTTNASGDVSISWTLGLALGAQTISATAAGVAGAGGTAAVAATAVPGAAKKLAFVQQPGTAGANSAISPAVTVAVQDSFGNVVTSSNAGITVALYQNSVAGAVLGGTLTATAVSGVASFGTLSLNKPGSYQLIASSGLLTNAISSSFAVTGGTPTQLAFAVQPGSTIAGSAIAPAVTVQLLDINNNLVPGATNSVTIAIAPGTGTAGAHVAGTLTANASSGVATFSGLSIDSAGSNYRLLASSTGLGSATSSQFSITPGAASALAFTTQPPTTGAGVAFGTVVAARDAQGNVATSFSGTVTVALTSGSGTAGAHLTGTLTVPAVAGVATFSGLKVDSAGTGYTLTAAASGLGNLVSAPFAITGGSASTIAFTTQPVTTAAGTAFNVVVTARDNLGNTAPGFTSNVTVAISAGTGTANAHLTGTTTLAAAAGVATFSLKVDSVGAGYTLTATTSGLSNVVSSAFAITAGAASALVFTTQPAGATAGSGFGAVVTARDNQGNRATGFTGNVTVAITSGTGTANAHLTGTATVAAAGGVATFSGLTVDSAGTGYTLTASASGTSNAVSSAFAISAGTASVLVFTTQPAGAVAGAGFGVVVTARDNQGNTAPTFTSNVTVAITGGTGTANAHLTGSATVAAVAGVATFSGLKVDSVGTGYTLTASAAGPGSGVSSGFAITAGAANALVFTTQPSGVIAGTGFGVVVTARDNQGNTATSFTGNVTVAITSGTGKPNAHLTGTATVAAAAGVATFSGLKVDSAATGYTLTASTSGASSGVSSAFAVSAGLASALVFTTEPADATAGAGFGVVVTARDNQGNTATGFGGNITVAITTGTGTANAHLTGTTTVTASAGVATFSGLKVDSVGTGYSLTASAAGTSNGISTAFAIIAGSGNTLVFTTQPPGAVAGTGFGVVVTARDNQGNTATGFNGNVTVAISAGTGTANAHLTGATTAQAAAGVATFSGLKVDSVGTGYTLTASAAGPGSGVSTGFAITAGVASALVFTTQPATTLTGSTFGVVVKARDNQGNTATGFTGSVSVAITSGSGNAQAHLSGTSSANAASGVATFSGLSIDSSGTAYTLTATASGTSPAVSSAFDVISAQLRTWTGSVSTDWNTAGNWTDGGFATTVPAAGTDVVIPSAPVNQPVLAGGSSTVRTVAVNSGAQLTLNATSLTASSLLTNQGTLIASGAAALGGAITTTSSSVIRVGQVDAGATLAALTVASGFTNNGAIELTVLTGTAYSSKLTVTSGTLVNASGGSISALPGAAAGGSRTLAATTNNQGAIHASTGLKISNGLTSSGTLDVSSPVEVASLQQTGGTVSGSSTLTVDGALTVGAGITALNVSELDLGGAISSAAASAVTPAKIVVFGSGIALANNVTYNTVQITGSGDTLTTNAEIHGDLSLGSGASFALNGKHLIVDGNFTSAGSARLAMAGNDSLTVQGNVSFTGGLSDSLGVQTGQTIQVGGDFTQTTTSFQPGQGLTVEFNGTAAQHISFSNPDSAGSYFGALKLSNTSSGGVALSSKVFLLGQLQTPASFSGTVTLFGNEHTVVARGLNANNMVIDAAPLVVNDGSGTSVQDSLANFNNVSFQNFAGSDDQLTVNRKVVPVTGFQMSGLSFQSVGSAGHFVVANNYGNLFPPLILIVVSSSPATVTTTTDPGTSAQVLLLNGAQVSWNP